MRRIRAILAAAAWACSSWSAAQTLVPGGSSPVPPAGAVSAAAPDSAGDAPLSIWMAASEAVPYAKTGGLADVVTSLSDELARQGHQVAIVLPLYKGVSPGEDAVPVASFHVPGDGGREVRLLRARRGSVDVLFLEHEQRFGSAGPYDAEFGGETTRFVFYSRAVLEAARQLGVKPDVLHAHDWHAALAVELAKRDRGFGSAVLTLHNMAFQGWVPGERLPELQLEGLEPQLRHNGGHSLLKAGIEAADKLTTVSRSYADEIRRHRHIGMGFEANLSRRSADLEGIVNGIDPSAWDPGADEALSARYDAAGASAGKAANKAALQSESGLAADPSAPLFGFAARLVEQKGIDLVADIAHDIAARGGQLAIAGAGDPHAERLRELSRRLPKSVYAPIEFSEKLARKIYAASDFLLMPSRFEPCGLSQQIAMRYGSIPIVSPTGGLLDTVVDSHTGLFLSEVTARALLEAVDRALALLRSGEKFLEMRAAGMARDASWGPAARAYLRTYRAALGR